MACFFNTAIFFFLCSVVSLHFKGLSIFSSALIESHTYCKWTHRGLWWRLACGKAVQRVCANCSKGAGLFENELNEHFCYIRPQRGSAWGELDFTGSVDSTLFPLSVQAFSMRSRLMGSDQLETLNCCARLLVYVLALQTDTWCRAIPSPFTSSNACWDGLYLPVTFSGNKQVENRCLDGSLDLWPQG